MSCKNDDQLKPTFQGYCATTHDAMLIFEACRSGILHPIPRRPKDKEKDLIRSGNIFVYSEDDTGIKRWTDGLHWSPSRVLSSFLVYRQLRVKYQPGERKRVVNRQQRPCSFSGLLPSRDRLQQISEANHLGSVWMAASTEEERNLVGSLTNSYDFKQDGLVKKTLTVFIDERPYHLVSYYTINAVKEKKLTTPSNSQILQSIIVPKDFLAKQNFRLYTSPLASPSTSFSEENIPERLAEYPYKISTLASRTSYFNPESDSSPVVDGMPQSYHQYGSFTTLDPFSSSKAVSSYIATPPSSHGVLLNPSPILPGNKDSLNVSLYRLAPTAHSKCLQSPAQPPSPALTIPENKDQIPYSFQKAARCSPVDSYTTECKEALSSDFQVVYHQVHQGLAKEHFTNLTSFGPLPTNMFPLLDGNYPLACYPNLGRERENEQNWQFSRPQGRINEQGAFVNSIFQDKFVPKYEYPHGNTG